MLKNKLKYIIKKILFKKMPATSFKNLTDGESNLIQELRNEVQEIEFYHNEKLTASETMWNNNVKLLRSLILEEDPRKFLTWNVIKRTMFVDTPLYILREFRYLKRKSNFKTDWFTFIRESEIGAPSKYYTLGESSGNIIHHAYHLAIFQDKTNKSIPETDFILEFGGGYGSMCRLIHQMKFKKKYVIFDLPIFSALQKYYLKSLGLRVLTINEFLENNSGILCLSSLSDLEFVLNKSDISNINASFLATWSLSETLLGIRKKVVKLIGAFNYFLIAYQLKFGEVDNITFFSEFSSEHKTVKWKDWNISHMKGSRYLVGYI